MIFLKKSILTISILAVAIWVMPAISDDISDLISVCENILTDYCKFADNATIDMQGTYGDKLKWVTVFAGKYYKTFYTQFRESRFMTPEVNNIRKYNSKKISEHINKEYNSERLSAIFYNNGFANFGPIDYTVVLLKNFALKYIKFLKSEYNQDQYSQEQRNVLGNQSLGAVVVQNVSNDPTPPITKFCKKTIPNNCNTQNFWTEFFSSNSDPELNIELLYPEQIKDI